MPLQKLINISYDLSLECDIRASRITRKMEVKRVAIKHTREKRSCYLKFNLIYVIENNFVKPK